MEKSKNKSDKKFDQLIYKTPYALIEKSNNFLGNHISTHVCRGCLSSYKSESVLQKHKYRCERQEITSIRTPDDSDLY